MSKKNKKIKKLQNQLEELNGRIDSLEYFLTNIVSKGFSSMFDGNGFPPICEDYEGEDNDALDFEEDLSLFTAEDEQEDEKPKKKGKKSKKKKDKKKSKYKEEDEEEEEEEEEEEDDLLHNISDTDEVIEIIEVKATKNKELNMDLLNTNLQQLAGIGPSLADKLNALGIKSIQDLVNLSEADEMQINEQIKGFSKKMQTNQWKEKAQAILDAQNVDNE